LLSELKAICQAILKKEKNDIFLRISVTFSLPKMTANLANLEEFTIEQVKSHSSPDSCWIIIDSLIFDISQFAASHPGGEDLILSFGGRDCTKEFYSFHRQQVLQKYAKLAIGRVRGGKQEIIQQVPGLISTVPYGEASYLQGFHSPYYNETHKKFRVAVREFYDTVVKEEAARFDEDGKAASKEVFLKLGRVKSTTKWLVTSTELIQIHTTIPLQQ
jgi:cytochrome b involved in lipid metabolism